MVIQKTKLPSYPNSVFFPSNNEKRTPQAQRNLLKRERFQPEHKAPIHHVEVGISDLHRNTAAYIPVHRGSRYAPPQRTPRVDEVESRGWGRRAPQSPSSSSFGAPQGNNKIYKCDVVFRIAENQYKRYKPNAVTLYAPARSNKIYKCDAVFLMEESKTNPISQTQFPYPPPNNPAKKRKKTAICARCINFRANYWQVGGVEIPLLLLQSYVDSCII